MIDSDKVLVGSNQETTLRELQLKSLEILIHFKDFCEEHDLQFFLYGGTCIGAIRHKGFIPWDDDIDVVMPRSDYEKLGKLWPKYNTEDKYVYCRTDNKVNLKHPMTTIRDTKTTYVRDYQVDLNIVHSVRLDIISLDACPNNKIQRNIQLGWGFIFHLFNREAKSSSHFNFIGKITTFILKVIKSSKLRYKIWRFAEKQMSKYPITSETENLTDLLSVFRIMKIKYPKEYFESAVYKEFEGHKMPVPVGYDEYLTQVFGDYMSYPSLDEQEPKHEALYINLNEPYEKFKGIEYCIKK